MEYHVFRKPRKLKSGKTVHRWYYYYLDVSGKQIQRSCGTKVRSRAAAEDYIRTLPPPPGEAHSVAGQPDATGSPHAMPVRLRSNPDMLVRDVALTMFLPGSPHVLRRQQLKKSVSHELLEAKRIFIKYIIEIWGTRMLRSLELDEVMTYLFSVKRSGSWKNQYLSVLKEVYQEAQFMGCKIFKPDFPTIGRDYNKADIFTEAELVDLFKPENFSPEFFFLFFLTSLSGGLRLGETSGLRAKQIIFDSHAVIVDGFLKNGERTIYNKRGTPEHPKLRVVPYPDLTLSLLKRHIEKNKVGPEDYVFTSAGKPVSKSSAEVAFIRALISAGIAYSRETLIDKGYWRQGHVQIKRDLIPDGRRIVPHSLRYTYITRMSRDMDAHSLIKITGHDRVDMIDYYNRRNLELALSSIPNADAANSSLLPAGLKG